MTIHDYIAIHSRKSKMVIGVGDIIAFREALKANPEMAVQARAMIEEGSRVVNGYSIEQRDHITRWRNELLRRALEG